MILNFAKHIIILIVNALSVGVKEIAFEVR